MHKAIIAPLMLLFLVLMVPGESLALAFTLLALAFFLGIAFLIGVAELRVAARKRADRRRRAGDEVVIGSTPRTPPAWERRRAEIEASPSEFFNEDGSPIVPPPLDDWI